MPVETPSEAYNKAKENWLRVRAVVAGQKAMQANAGEFVRRPQGFDDEEWERYVKFAPFLGATSRTLDGITGLVFFNDPKVVVPKTIEAINVDATGDGVPLRAFAQRVFSDVLQTEHTGILVDFPKADPNIRNRRDEDRSGRRPYLAHYPAESIISWRMGKVRGTLKLVEVRLCEEVEVQKDEWDKETVERIRVLQIADPENPVYVQRVFEARKVGEKGMFIELLEEATTPKINGKTLDYIPFWFINPIDQTPSLSEPPLLPLANANAAHYNTSAQLEHGLFYVAMPQPYVCGVDKEDLKDEDGKEVLKIGSGVWTFPDHQAKVAYLEFQGQGLESLEKRLDRHEQAMAILGARMLAPDKKDAETAEAAQIHRQGEISVAAMTARSVSAGITDALRVCAEWQGAAGECTYALNVEFLNRVLTPSEAAELMKLWQSGAIAYTDMLALFQKGQLIKPERTPEEIAAEIQSSPVQPMFTGLTDNEDDPEDNPENGG
ncbi:MAG: DUF4055 domain-containing protein [Pseudomonadota bacterium]|nr:DUF4055 domain-containing protein [Pseudomonadota bacterium]